MTKDDILNSKEKIFFTESNDSTGTAIEIDTVREAMDEYAKQQLETALKEILKGEYRPNEITVSHILKVFKALGIEEETKCTVCGGDGYTVEVEAECCGNYKDYGCCGNPNPVQVQVECKCDKGYIQKN